MIFKYIYLLSLFVVLFYSTVLVAQTDKTSIVFKEAPKTSNLEYNSFRFFDLNHGIVVNQRSENVSKLTIYSTQNGGQDWQSTEIDSASHIGTICWPSADTIYLFGKSASYGCNTQTGESSASTLFSSFDGGNSWTKKFVFGPCEFHDAIENIAFVNGKVGILGLTQGFFNLGQHAGLYLTKNGGVSWQKLASINDVKFIANEDYFLFSTGYSTVKVDQNGQLIDQREANKFCAKKESDQLVRWTKTTYNDSLFTAYASDCGNTHGYPTNQFTSLEINQNVMFPSELYHFTNPNGHNLGKWNSITESRQYGGAKFGYMDRSLDSFFYMRPPQKPLSPFVPYDYLEINSQYFNDTLGYHLGILNDSIVVVKMNGNQTLEYAISSNKILKEVGIDEQSASSSSVIFPNPVSESLVLHWQEANIDRFRVMNSIGQIMVDKLLPEQGEYIIDVSTWPDGYYLLVGSGNQAVITERFVVQH